MKPFARLVASLVVAAGSATIGVLFLVRTYGRTSYEYSEWRGLIWIAQGAALLLLQGIVLTPMSFILGVMDKDDEGGLPVLWWVCVIAGPLLTFTGLAYGIYYSTTHPAHWVGP